MMSLDSSNSYDLRGLVDDVSLSEDFRVDYAKSGRSLCHGCDCLIPKSVLRIAVLTNAPDCCDILTPTWYHFRCFWQLSYLRVPKEDKIIGFENLKPADKERIRLEIAKKQFC